MKQKLIILLLILSTGHFHIEAQDDDLESLLEEEMGTRNDAVLGTFLSTFVLNNHSVELLDSKGLNFRLSHKFGFLNSGRENFFGFDNSSVFTAFDFAPADWINIGIGRGTFRESFNTMFKLRILRQKEGSGGSPISIVLYSELDCKTKKYSNDELQKDFVGRMDYTTQLLLARKFGNTFSFQIMPGYIHRNLVETNKDLNGIASVGFGGTYKLAKRLRLNAEYFWVQNHDTPTQTFYSPFSVGICHQTSRHAFELFATNSTGITSNNHIAYTTGDFWSGDICIAFNVSTVFSIRK